VICPHCRDGHSMLDPEVGVKVEWCRCGYLDTRMIGKVVCRCEDAPCCGCDDTSAMLLLADRTTDPWEGR